MNDVRILKACARENPRLRCRLCTHPAPEDAFHEMLIVHHRDAYFRPHLHRGRSQSFHVWEGEMTVVLLDASGAVTSSFEVGALGDDDARPAYVRIPADTYYYFHIRSEFVAFFEVTTGPFDPASTVWAPWSPADGEHTAYVRALVQRLEQL